MQHNVLKNVVWNISLTSNENPNLHLHMNALNEESFVITFLKCVAAMFQMYVLRYKYPDMMSPPFTPATTISLNFVLFIVVGVNAQVLGESVSVNGRFGKWWEVLKSSWWEEDALYHLRTRSWEGAAGGHGHSREVSEHVSLTRLPGVNIRRRPPAKQTRKVLTVLLSL